MDLRHSLIPDELVEEMINTMPEHKGSGGQEDKNQPKYDYITFMERFMGGSSGNGTQKPAAPQESTFKATPGRISPESTFRATPARSSSPVKAHTPLVGDSRKNVDIF